MEYNLLAIDEQYLRTLPSPQAGWGKRAPHDPTKQGVIRTLKTVRQFPTTFNETSMETIHPSVACQENLVPGLAKIFEENTPNLVEKLLPFEERMRLTWNSLRQENDLKPIELEAESNGQRRMLFTDFLKAFHGLVNIGRLSVEIIRGASTDEEAAEKVLLEQ